jgi:hypothetical protein
MQCLNYCFYNSPFLSRACICMVYERFSPHLQGEVCVSTPNTKLYIPVSGICFRRLTAITNVLSHDSWCPGQDSNRVTPENSSYMHYRFR